MRNIILRSEKFGGVSFEVDSGKMKYLTVPEFNDLLKKESTDGSIKIKLIKNPNFYDSYLNAPEGLGIDITQKCNLKCPQCYKNSGKATAEELTKKEIFNIIDQASEIGMFLFFISGGEPTCREDLFEVMDYANKKNMRCVLTTNGVYGISILDKIIKSNPLFVQISIDGTEKIHDAVRGNGNYLRALESIKYLRSKGVNVQITNHLCLPNVGCIADLVKLASDLNVSIKFSLMRPIGRNKSESVGILSKKQVHSAVAEFISLKKKYPNTKISGDFDKAFLDESIQCFSGAEFKNCMAGDRKLTIDSFGNVFPCSFFTPFSEFNAGNLRKEKLVDIWKNSSVLSRLRNRKVCDECAFCSKYKKSCLAGCPAISFAALGDENALDPTCPFK